MAAILLVVMQGALAACSPGWTDRDPLSFLGSSKRTQPAQPLAPSPPMIVDPLAQLPAYSPQLGGDLGTFGFNLGTYMLDEVTDPVDRIDRLERVVLAMHKDMRAMAPAVQNLTKLEREVESMQAGVHRAPPPSIMPASARNTPQPLIPSAPTPSVYQKPVTTGAPAAVASGNQVVISGLRVGHHPDRVRLVLDASRAAPYSADIDNGEKILVIDLPNTVWRGPMQERFSTKSPLASYRVEKSGSGHMIIVQLRRTSSIVKQIVLDALSGSGKRIVVDISA